VEANLGGGEVSQHMTFNMPGVVIRDWRGEKRWMGDDKNRYGGHRGGGRETTRWEVVWLLGYRRGSNGNHHVNGGTVEGLWSSETEMVLGRLGVSKPCTGFL